MVAVTAANALTILHIYQTLHSRYVLLAKGTIVETRVTGMMQAILDNCYTWPPDKTGRWTGYVQCLLIEIAGVTTIENERDFTRPFFHRLYSESGYDIPDTILLGSEHFIFNSDGVH